MDFSTDLSKMVVLSNRIKRFGLDTESIVYAILRDTSDLAEAAKHAYELHEIIKICELILILTAKTRNDTKKFADKMNRLHRSVNAGAELFRAADRIDTVN